MKCRHSSARQETSPEVQLSLPLATSTCK